MITLTIGKSWVAGVWLLSGPQFLLGTKPRNDLAVYHQQHWRRVGRLWVREKGSAGS